MIIIFAYIPASTQKQDLEEFIRPVIKGNWLRKSGQIEKTSILVLKNTQTNKVEYHGLVTIMPDSAAKRALIKLNKKPINGRRVVIREFKIRRWQNDPRITRRDLIQGFRNKRQGDRRLRCEEIKLKVEEDISALFSSEYKFSNKMGDDAS